jgi:hypothetical protein
MKVVGGPAIAVTHIDKTPVGNIAIQGYLAERKVVGGPATPIYFVSEDEVTLGIFKVDGGSAIPIYEVVDREVVAGNPIPIYVQGMSLQGLITINENDYLLSDGVNELRWR